MRLSVKCVERNEYTGDDHEVSPERPFAFWRVVEHTGAGWFP